MSGDAEEMKGQRQRKTIQSIANKPGDNSTDSKNRECWLHFCVRMLRSANEYSNSYFICVAFLLATSDVVFSLFSLFWFVWLCSTDSCRPKQLHVYVCLNHFIIFEYSPCCCTAVLVQTAQTAHPNANVSMSEYIKSHIEYTIQCIHPMESTFPFNSFGIHIVQLRCCFNRLSECQSISVFHACNIV